MNNSAPIAQDEVDLSVSQMHPTLQRVFVFAGLILAIFLAISIPFQTQVFEGVDWFKQPRTWPSVAIFGMLLSWLGHLYFSRQQRQSDDPHLSISQEGRVWKSAFLVAFIFLVYVKLVTNLGYLPSSLLLACVLIWYSGYQDRRYYFWGFFAVFAIVLLFKTGLQVKIPGGAAYEYLPDPLRNFMKIHF